jgi:hypothetical protein
MKLAAVIPLLSGKNADELVYRCEACGKELTRVGMPLLP